MKKNIIYLILIVLFLNLANTDVAHAEVSEPQITSKLEGSGTHFELNNSKYLNITLDSSFPIKLILESIPEMVTMHFESSSGAASIQVTLSGFLPLTTYHRYEDDYHNHIAFTTDASGNYSYTQDLSVPHIVFIQPRASTKFIRDDATGGNCTSIGTWDAKSKTCILTTDLTETVQIDSNDITLDGNGYTITGSGTGSGVYLTGRSSVTIKNVNVRKFSYGIYLHGSSNNSLTNNTANSNSNYGICLYGSSNNILSNNTISGNRYNFYLDGNSDSDFSHNIDTSNTVDGKPIYYVKNAVNQIYDNSTNAGIFYCINCYNISIKGLTLNKNMAGIFLWKTRNSRIENILATDNYNGISLSSASNNMITGNTVSNNNYGISMFYDTPSSYDCLSSDYPPYYYPCYDSYYDYLYYNNNTIYNNLFNNTNNLDFSRMARNIWNTTKTAGTSITGGPYLGGNVWADPSGTGFSQTCADANNDRICDSSYTLSSDNIDYLPLAYDTKPPAGVTNLRNKTFEQNYINWTWNDPHDPDFSHVMIYIDGKFKTNVSRGVQYYNAKGLSADARHTIATRTVDTSGNINQKWVNSTAKTAPIPDTVPPETTAVLSGKFGNNSWYNSSVLVNLTATDNKGGSGIKKTEYSFNGLNWSTAVQFTITNEGMTTIYYRSSDNAGNVEQTRNQRIKIDMILPNINISGVTDGSYYNSDVTPVITITDANLNTQSITLNGIQFTNGTVISREGNYTLVISAVDMAGNSISKTVNFVIDRTSPEAAIRFDTISEEIKVYNNETGGEVNYVVMPSDKDEYSWEEMDEDDWELRQYMLKDYANNSLVLVLDHKREREEAKVRIISIQYNSDVAIKVARNKMQIEYSEEKNGVLRGLEQEIDIKKQLEVEAEYIAKNNETELKVKIEGQKKQKETREGIVVLELLTDKGGLKYR